MQPCKPISPSSSTPRAAPPPWVDPAAIMALSAWKLRIVQLDAVNPVVVAPADPKRVALGVGQQEPVDPSIRIAPHGSPELQGWAVGVSGEVFWWTLFTHGPLVTAQWNAPAFTGSPLYVYELYRLS